MGKRIRHLEYYGYNDQNVYIGLPNMDLSDIRETNREQDRDISEISGATKEKADISMVEAVSGQVDTFIDVQSHINKKLIGAVKATFDQIDKLKERDVEITDKINEISDKFDPIYDQLGVVSNDISSIEEKLNAHLSESDTTNGKVDEIGSAVEGKLDKDYAEETYAKKEDTYTKREVDNAIESSVEGLASKEWVIGKEYLTLADADGRYARSSRLNEIEDRVTDVQTKMYSKYNELKTSLDGFKNDTNNRIDTAYGRLDTLEKKHDREIANLQNKDVDLQDQIDKNKTAIKEINDVSLPNKVDNATFNALKENVESIKRELGDKVDNDAYERYKSMIGEKLDNLDNKKADKTALALVKDSVDALSRDLEKEINDRAAADNSLSDTIGKVNDRVNGIVEENIERDKKAEELKTLLGEETTNRVKADEAIIGNENDKATDVTLYGVRKYADLSAANALKNAKEYTDTLDSNIRQYVDEKDTDLERQITAKANKAYVDSIRDEIEKSIAEKLEKESGRASDVEDALERKLNEEIANRLSEDNSLSSSLDHTTNIVRAITDWDGDDLKDYTDEGNGILDVLHREFHAMKETIAELKAKVEELEKK